jgi:hypothetical protein
MSFFANSPDEPPTPMERAMVAECIGAGAGKRKRLLEDTAGRVLRAFDWKTTPNASKDLCARIIVDLRRRYRAMAEAGDRVSAMPTNAQPDTLDRVLRMFFQPSYGSEEEEERGVRTLVDDLVAALANEGFVGGDAVEAVKHLTSALYDYCTLALEPMQGYPGSKLEFSGSLFWLQLSMRELKELLGTAGKTIDEIGHLALRLQHNERHAFDGFKAELRSLRKKYDAFVPRTDLNEIWERSAHRERNHGDVQGNYARLLAIDVRIQVDTAKALETEANQLLNAVKERAAEEEEEQADMQRLRSRHERLFSDSADAADGGGDDFNEALERYIAERRNRLGELYEDPDDFFDDGDDVDEDDPIEARVGTSAAAAGAGSGNDVKAACVDALVRLRAEYGGAGAVRAREELESHPGSFVDCLVRFLAPHTSDAAAQHEAVSRAVEAFLRDGRAHRHHMEPLQALREVTAELSHYCTHFYARLRGLPMFFAKDYSTLLSLRWQFRMAKAMYDKCTALYKRLEGLYAQASEAEQRRRPIKGQRKMLKYVGALMAQLGPQLVVDRVAYKILREFNDAEEGLFGESTLREKEELDTLKELGQVAHEALKQLHRLDMEMNTDIAHYERAERAEPKRPAWPFGKPRAK